MVKYLMFFGLVGLSACSVTQSPIISTLQEFWQGADASHIRSVTLNPKFLYLRVDLVGGGSSLLVLSDEDQVDQRNIKVWISAHKEIVRTQNGRLVAVEGVYHLGQTISWRINAQPLSASDWGKIPPSGLTFDRVKSSMPGYKVAAKERVQLHWVTHSAPPIKVVDLPFQSIEWLREDYETLDGAPEKLPSSWFGIRRQGQIAELVFAYQCLNPDFCLMLRPWPAQKVEP